MTDPTPFLDSTAVAADGPELSRRMQRDGYLFVRGLLPPEPLETLRLKFLGIARDAGWVARGEPLAEAVADLDGFCVEPQPDYMGVYAEMYKLQEFHALQHHPAILGLLERLDPRARHAVARNAIPGNAIPIEDFAKRRLP